MVQHHCFYWSIYCAIQHPMYVYHIGCFEQFKFSSAIDGPINHFLRCMNQNADVEIKAVHQKLNRLWWREHKFSRLDPRYDLRLWKLDAHYEPPYLQHGQLGLPPLMPVPY